MVNVFLSRQNQVLSGLSQEKLSEYGQPGSSGEEDAVEVLLSGAAVAVGLVDGEFTEVVEVMNGSWLVVVEVVVVASGQVEPAQLVGTEYAGEALGDEGLRLDVVGIDLELEVETVEALGLAREEPLGAPGLDGLPLRSAALKFGLPVGFEQLYPGPFGTSSEGSSRIFP